MTEIATRLAKARTEVNDLKNGAARAVYAINRALEALAAQPVTPTVPSPPPPAPPAVDPFPPAPTVSLLDAEIDGAAREVHVTVQLSGPVRHTVYVPVNTFNGNDPDGTKRLSQGFGYTRHEETLIFRPGDEPRRTVAVKLPGTGKPGQWFGVGTTASVEGAAVAKPQARVTIVPGATTTPHTGARAPVHVPRKGAVTFAPDLSKIEASDNGQIDGRRVWVDRLRHGRTQDGNGELGYYAPGNFASGPEGLTLKSQKLASERRATVNGASRVFDYDGSVLMTNGLFSQQYGYFECEAKTPSARGSWGAFWLLPSRSAGWWPPEIDIFEHPRNHQLTSGDTTATHHWGTEQNVKRIGVAVPFAKLFKPGFDATTAFHTYAVDWREDYTTWFVDGIEVFRAPTEFHTPAYLLLNVAVGGWGGPPDYSKGTTDMIVRDLKVYA